jgi:hypothetical protein
MPKKRIDHIYTCDKCDKPATKNLQQNWQLYDVLPDGDFVLNDEWEGDNNEFYCDKCYEKEMAN